VSRRAPQKRSESGGTSLIEADKLSWYSMFIRGTGPAVAGVQAVSETENCQDILNFNCGQMRVSGCSINYKAALSARVKAKSVTNNLPILSVLGGRSILLNFK